MPVGFILRSVFAALILQLIALSGHTIPVRTSHAGTADRAGNNADVYSITISPASTGAGVYPEIKGFVRNTSLTDNGRGGKAVFDVVAEITLPGGAQKSMVWREVQFSADQRKSYAAVNSYDVRQPGTYKVVYSVYNAGRTHRYGSLAKTFTVTAAAVAKQPEPKPETKRQEAKKRETPRKTEIVERRAQPPADRERNHFGLGGYINTLNFSGGGTLVVWPLKDLALQGTYGVGTFKSYEGRIFYRVPVESDWKPYVGAGYLHASRDTTVIGMKTTVSGSSATAFGGLEVRIYKNLFGYVDVSATPLKLKKDVTNGAQAVTVTVEYSPVTINTGLVFYLF